MIINVVSKSGYPSYIEVNPKEAAFMPIAAGGNGFPLTLGFTGGCTITFKTVEEFSAFECLIISGGLVVKKANDAKTDMINNNS